MRPPRLLAVATLAVLILTGCSTADDTSATPRPSSTAVRTPAAALLDGFGLRGMDTVEVIDHLDRLSGDERPAGLTASVRPDELRLESDGTKSSLPIPKDRFYLSVAPYVDETHDCFYHSLTTCTGELAGKRVRVRLTDTTHGTVLVDEVRTTYANGFVGFWLPRDIEGTLRISYDGRSAETAIATDKSAPTCLTTLALT